MNIDNDFLFHWNNNNIGPVVKTIIEKSLETNNIISNYKIETQNDIKKILSLLSDDITICQSLHSVCSFLQNINPTKHISKAETMLSNHENHLNTKVGVYNKLVEIKNYNNSGLLQDDIQFIDRLLKSYEKEGIKLSNTNKILLQQLDNEINNVQLLIQTHIRNSENKILNIPYDNLDGMPLHIINTFENVDCDNIKIKLNKVNYDLCMSHVKNRKIRKEIDTIYAKNKYEKILNHVGKLIVLRNKHDTLLSYNNHTEYVLSGQMCKTTEQSQSFLKKLIKKVDLVNKLENKSIWDIQYDINQWKLEKGLNSDSVKEYFEIHDVVDKIIKIYELIFGVKFTEIRNASKWCNELMVFSIIHPDTQTEGYLYLDLFNREGKYNQIRCFCLQSACMYPVLSGKYIKPIISLCASFGKFTNGVSLLNYDDVVSIFHEFGHVMHHIFGKTKYIIFSGTNVEDDFIEVPAQIMELLCYEPYIIKYLSQHYRKKEKMSDNLINKLIALKTLEDNLNYKKNVIISYFDQIIYSSPNFVKLCDTFLTENKPDHIQSAFVILFEKLYKEIITDNSKPLIPHEFIQTVCDYDSQYYNLLWTKMLAVDLYNENIKGKHINAELGTKLINCILKFGGSKSAFEMCALYIGKDIHINDTHDSYENNKKSSSEKMLLPQKNIVNKKHKNKKQYIENDWVESVSNNFCEIIDE